MSGDPFSEYDIQEPPFDDWVRCPNDIVREEHVLDAIGLSEGDVPRFRAAVLHDNYVSHQTGDMGSIVRVEARIGESMGIADRYSDEVSSIKNNPYYKTFKNGDDPTYVSFFFDVPPILQKVVDEF